MTRPIRQWQILTTIAIIVLSSISTLLGLIRQGHYTPELLPAFYVQDLIMLLVAVPVLAISLRYAMAGSRRGRLVWLGALAYMSYMWATIGLQVPFNRFFLGYVLLFGLSLFTFIAGLVAVNTETFHRSFSDRTSERVYGGFLSIIAIGLAFLWLAELVPATITGKAPLLVEEIGPQALVSHFLDLAIVVPALAISARFLWRRQPCGYVFAGVGLVFGALLSPTITGMTIALLVDGEVTVPVIALVLTVSLAVVAAVLAVRYLLAITDDESFRSAVEADRPSDGDYRRRS